MNKRSPFKNVAFAVAMIICSGLISECTGLRIFPQKIVQPSMVSCRALSSQSTQIKQPQKCDYRHRHSSPLFQATLSSPQAENNPERKDNIIERFCIFLLASVLTTILPDRSVAPRLVRKDMTFGDFVKLTKALLRLGNAEDIKMRIVNLLSSLLPLPLRTRIQWMAKHRTQFLCEKSSLWMSFGWLGWLVGPCHRFDVQIRHATNTKNNMNNQKIKVEDTASISDNSILFASASASASPTTLVVASSVDNSITSWKSGIKLEKCRYLSEAGCKSACIHLCKRPTEAFFNEELGIPLYMKPDFETSSCELHFGMAPPAVQEDPAYAEACFTTCPAIHRNRQLNQQTMSTSTHHNNKNNNNNLDDNNQDSNNNDDHNNTVNNKNTRKLHLLPPDA